MKIPSEYVQVEWNAREFSIYDSRKFSFARSTKMITSRSSGACLTRWKGMTNEERICEIYVIFEEWLIKRDSCDDSDRNFDIAKAMINLNKVEGISIEDAE